MGVRKNGWFMMDINPMKSYEILFKWIRGYSHLEPPYAEILNVIHGTNGLFLPGPRLVPMAHRNHPQLGRDGPLTLQLTWRNHCYNG